ncbi:MAG TPA: WD40 repeat domain-containing protein [Cyanobacteria bacterium UBA8803]|nr:WD40 repeat domain-containing protein [Cyanobacteria bacterium UBA9273]HBL60877.1 WD40 repeat domain-containing protein [Cyanobacteria bacterium UBA8803]
MVNNSHQPRDYDAVLSTQNLAPTNAAILGGIDGVRQRLASQDATIRSAALKDAQKYGESGLDLIIRGLQDESLAVQQVAYLLLRERKELSASRALRGYIPYRLFECLDTFKAGQEIALSPDGNWIAYLRGKNIRISNLHTNELLYTIPKYPKAQEILALSNDIKTLIRVRNSSSNVIEIWYQGELRHSLYGHEGEIGAIAISPDGQTIATGSKDKTIKIWNLKTGKLLHNFDNRLIWGAHTDEILCVTFSPDGKTLASSSRDGKIKLWYLYSSDRPLTLKGYATVVAINPDGLTLATTNWSSHIQLWNLSTHKVERTLAGYAVGVRVLTFGAYGRIVVSGGIDKSIKFWDVATGEEIQTLTGHQDAVTCLTLTPDGQRLVSGSLDRTVKVWGVS